MLAVLECGRYARRALGAEACGEVCALSRKSYYLRFAGGAFLCVGKAALGRGPLNALIARLELPSEGAAVWLSLAGARLWQPGPLRFARGRRALEARTAALLCIAARPEQGLGRTIAGGSTPLIEHARPALGALGEWLETGGAPPDAIEHLIGLGPGLTPSGDDYLGGILLGLRGAGREADADALWAWLEPRLAARTSALSAAHLAAAAAGEAHEALHECLEALLGETERDLAAPLARLAALGHCSGWDGLAGALAAARAR